MVNFLKFCPLSPKLYRLPARQLPSRQLPTDGCENDWLRRMLFLDELEPLVAQTQKVAEFGSKSATSNAPSADAGNERETCDAR